MGAVNIFPSHFWLGASAPAVSLDLCSVLLSFFYFSTRLFPFRGTSPLVFSHPKVPLNQVLYSRFSGRFAASKGAYFTEKHSEQHQAQYEATLFLQVSVISPLGEFC